MSTAANAVRMIGITKHFGGVRALQNVNLEVQFGEVHALLGGNGAGKSTILKVLNGVHTPDEGWIEVSGRPLTEHSPEASRAAGIAMNYQEMSLVPSLTVAQNIFLTRETLTGAGLINDSEAEKRATGLFDLLGVQVNPRAYVEDLGAGQKQLTEIAKAISQDADVLILDEPSTALAVSDVDRLFDFLGKFKARGKAVIYVSHRMDEISRIADRATILRDGRHVITAPIAELPIDTMIEHIVGSRSLGLADVKRQEITKGEVLLELENVSGKEKPHNANLTIHRGEVVGLAGLLGSGRTSLAKIVAGLAPLHGGEMRINGEKVVFRTPGDAIEAGVGLVPESRATQGIIATHAVSFNLTLSVLKRITKMDFVDQSKVNEIAGAQVRSLSIKAASPNHAVSTLSGGNQQKVVIGKWLATDPDLLVLDEPTAGIDIGSKSEIVRIVRELAKMGKAILLISSELSELLTACDRIVVLSEGHIHSDQPRVIYDDEVSHDADLSHQLQAAEQLLQAEIQKALSTERGTNNDRY